VPQAQKLTTMNKLTNNVKIFFIVLTPFVWTKL